MDRIVYDALSSYYNALSKKGYMPYSQAIKLLVLTFYWNFLYYNYRHCISNDDYRKIEKALYCLFGSSCLIPYPDYLKMGKLHLGDMAEMACRVKALEDANVVKVIHKPEEIISSIDSDVIILAEEDN